MMNKYTKKSFVKEIIVIAITVIFASPFYFLIVNSLKTTKEAYANPFGLPKELYWQSFSEVLSGAGVNADFIGALFNSLIITAGSLLLLVAFGSLTAYGLSRHPGKLSSFLYVFFVIGIIIPSQLGLVPIYTALRSIGLVGSRLGMILVYACKQMPLTVFLYTGFFKSLPEEYEEAAVIDGAGFAKSFVYVVMPQMKTITGTALLLNSLYIWNDTMDQMVFLSGSAIRTLPVEIYSLTTAMTAQWNLVFAAVIVSLLPMVILYLFTQKKMMESLAGGLKG